MIDSLIVSKPGDENILMSAVQAYVAYSSVLDVCDRTERSLEVGRKAKQYGLELLALHNNFPGQASAPETFSSFLEKIEDDHLPQLFWAGFGWAAWVLTQEGSPESMIDLGKIEQIMLRVVEMDENYYNGAAHVFLGGFYGSRPALFGGRLEESRQHFEKALQLNKRQYLPTQVTYAETYARLTFDRQLFTDLLHEVLDYPINDNPENVLANQVAKRNARKLLEAVDTYF